jgi:hypothetical protein
MPRPASRAKLQRARPPAGGQLRAAAGHGGAAAAVASRPSRQLSCPAAGLVRALVSEPGQRGFNSCPTAPNPPAGVTTWSTPIGFALDRYDNTTSLPVPITSVALLDAHHRKVHGALVYEIVHSQHPLPYTAPRAGLAAAARKDRVPAAEWVARQPVPGAHPPRALPPGPARPAGPRHLRDRRRDVGDQPGRRLGHRREHYLPDRDPPSLAGYAISGTLTNPDYCRPQMNAINHAWAN